MTSTSLGLHTDEASTLLTLPQTVNEENDNGRTEREHLHTQKSETELTASVLEKKIQNTREIRRTLFN